MFGCKKNIIEACARIVNTNAAWQTHLTVDLFDIWRQFRSAEI